MPEEPRASKRSSPRDDDSPRPPKLQRQRAIGCGGFVDPDIDGRVDVVMARDVLRGSIALRRRVADNQLKRRARTTEAWA